MQPIVNNLHKKGLVAFVDEVGYFGTLLLTHKDWDQPELHKRSMVLLAEKVLPQVNAAIGGGGIGG